MTTKTQQVPAGTGHVIAPYITTWSGEEDVPRQVVERRGLGIGFADETVLDRDRHHVLWRTRTSRPGHGRPQFGNVHPQRQRRAMRKLLCQVCAGPADQTDEGVLWLIPDLREDWPGWPARMGLDEPPVCRPCVRLSVRLCPALRRGAAAIRARKYPIVGVWGAVYTRTVSGLQATEVRTVGFEDPAIRWTRAERLIRQVDDCDIVPLDDL
ncbi:MAG: hypothetical protein GEV28_17755 [Actinophytocola sp.]|uniref:hypothetical protein n=1 Tax=Actinophytocola sp. TaxID=1872138 RepID=UPI001327B37F|nr:hypothetical protein [Actinophytocola sp.]MPZ82134.1 hypothetical protein [Actinophytocola sp.]